MNFPDMRRLHHNSSNKAEVGEASQVSVEGIVVKQM